MTVPYSALEIEEKLEELLAAVLSSRRTASEPAAQLSNLNRASQDFTLHWADVIAKSNSEMAFQFVSFATKAFSLMDIKSIEMWIIEAMDIYDRQGLYPGSACFREVEKFASQLTQSQNSVEFEEIAGVLTKFARGVSGRHLEIRVDNEACTDTEAIYLPKFVTEFDSKPMNFQLYKATSAFLLAQTRYGTFRVNSKTGIPVICSEIQKFRDQTRALRLFEAVEEVRLLTRIESDYPGLGRQLKELRSSAESKTPLDQFELLLDLVRDRKSTVKESLRVVRTLYSKNVDVRNPFCYQGVVDLEKVRLITKQRVERERDRFRTELATLSEAASSEEEVNVHDGEPEERRQISLNESFEPDENNDWEMTIMIDGKPVSLSDEMVQTAQSIVQDFGEIPEDYLVPAGDSQYQADNSAQERDSDRLLSKNSEVFYYDEWDYRRCHYRKNWCALKELDMHPSYEPKVEQILEKHAHLVRDIRKTFELLRGDNKTLRRQKNGDDIDIDAVVQSYADVREGHEMTDRIFIQSRKIERDLAVVFMVDVSGSTKGWINEAERESLVLLCEALQTLGDRYAIYGFSGMTRKRCEVYRIKKFDEPYSSTVKARIAGMRPQDYTRMGVVIRHLSEKLMAIDAKTRVLITISDGKPDDYDGYRGEYGIEDTRQALMEVKHAGIHPFCITIDSRAHDYLPHMYGHVNYTVVSDVGKLPFRVSEIYRRLTT